MKKVLVILTLAFFIGGISVPALASNNNALTLIELRDDDPKKKKAKKSKEATKSGDCTQEKKSDCSSKCKGEK